MLRTLAIDKRFQVGVALDAWMWPLKDESPQLASRIEQPILFINMEAFQNGRSLKVMKRFTDANSRAQVYTLRLGTDRTSSNNSNIKEVKCFQFSSSRLQPF